MEDWNKDINEWTNEKELINVKKDCNDSGLENIETEKYKNQVEKTYQIIKQIEDIGMPKSNEQLKLITFKTFNSVLFLKHIAEKEKINNIIIVVYSINHEAAKIINDMIINKTIKNATILISNLRNKAHRVKEQLTRDLFVNNPNIDLFFCQSHAKIISMETENGNYYTIEGSGNLSFNSRIEQYSIENSKDYYLFNKNWILKIKDFLKNKKELILT